MVRHTTTAIIGLLASLGGTAALAGRGDLDPSYGAGGRLTAATAFFDPGHAADLIALQLPDDRLMTFEFGVVRRFDAEGRPDLTFGDNGAITIPPFPAATPLFNPLFQPVATPDGGLVIAGLLYDESAATQFEALIRLDRNGNLLTSFGGNGDGLYRLTTEPIPQICGGACTALRGVAVDQAGRVLLAKRGWNGPGRCAGRPTVERLTPDGVIDSAFGANGGADITGVDLCAGALVFGARNDDSIVVGGSGVVIGLDASGARDTNFGSTGLLSLASSVAWSSAQLLPHGGLLLAGSRPESSQPGIVLAKFNASGQPDALFGEGTGVVQQDFGQAFVGISGLQTHVSAMESTEDGGRLYLQISLMRSEGDAVCAGGIARLHGDGTVDSSFGERGLTCLDYGAFPFALIGLQRDGAPLFGRLDGSVYRLLLDATASPGFLTLARSGVTHEVGEKDGNATISVVRTAGHDGAVSAHFYTRAAPPVCHCMGCCNTFHIAAADSDYLTASGRIEWADGEEGSRSTNVEILDDLDQEVREIFLVIIDEPQGGSELYGDTRLIVAIDDDDGIDSDNGSADSDNGSAQTDGGGGSIPWYVVAVLAALAARARARPRHARRQS
jgi:uncharacterized delta-60 repeat protein